jgi:acetylornithine deacetylase/succinyl-diaminopimelate desuccinylase-like protein
MTATSTGEATDDEDHLVAGLMAMLLLKRQGTRLERDVIFLAESGEEGTVRVGIEFVVKQQWPEIECEFASAEGGGGLKHDGIAWGRPRIASAYASARKG